MIYLIIGVVLFVTIAVAFGWFKSDDYEVPANAEVPVEDGEPLLLADLAQPEIIEVSKVATLSTVAAVEPVAAPVRKPRAKKLPINEEAGAPVKRTRKPRAKKNVAEQ